MSLYSDYSIKVQMWVEDFLKWEDRWGGPLVLSDLSMCFYFCTTESRFFF